MQSTHKDILSVEIKLSGHLAYTYLNLTPDTPLTCPTPLPNVCGGGKKDKSLCQWLTGELQTKSNLSQGLVHPVGWCHSSSLMKDENNTKNQTCIPDILYPLWF